MSPILLAVYLLLVGIMALIETKIPGWVVGVTALAAGGAVLIEKVRSK